MQSQDVIVASYDSNSNYDEFAPTLYKDGLVFCSDRPSRFGISYVDAQGNFPTIIYSSNNKKNKVFSESLSSKLNQGPACFNKEGTSFIYTGTIETGKKSLNKSPGIFTCNWSGDGWSVPISFEYNSTDASYSVGHPALSIDGNYLYFCSDLPGGYGGQDIYVCKKEKNGWEKPTNLGQNINSGSDEIFPFISNTGKLYFSSNRQSSLSGFNIYSSAKESGIFVIPILLKEPLNSMFDDFSITLAENEESGFFASNRNGKNDDIYQFQISFPSFENCPPIELPSFCYLFEENNIVPNDSMPMLFEWELGDGNIVKGLSIEYCYKNFGQYHVALNVYDSLTRAHFAKVSEVDIAISKSPYPYIESLDTLSVNELVALTAEGTDMSDFKPEDYFWDFGDGSHGRGYEVGHTFNSPGYYNVQLGVIRNNANGEIEKRCASKTIAVGSILELSALNLTSDNTPQKSSLQEDMILLKTDSIQKLSPSSDSTVYFIEFHESAQPLPVNDPFFNNIKYEITERFDETDTAYRYSVGHTTDIEVMMRVHQDMTKNGYIKSIVREEIKREFKDAIVQTWWYVPDSMQTAINKHLNKFNDIRFDVGTYDIKKESFDNLAYIAEVMNLEKSLKLLIKAHTDSIGTTENNYILSQKRAAAVVDYLTSQGVNKNRLQSKGYGEVQPVANNTEETGRAVNRRVEFEILFDERKKGK